MKKILLSIGEIVVYDNHLRIVEEFDDVNVYFRDKIKGQCNKGNIEFVSKISKQKMRTYVANFSNDNEFYTLVPLLSKDEEDLIIDLILE